MGIRYQVASIKLGSQSASPFGSDHNLREDPRLLAGFVEQELTLLL